MSQSVKITWPFCPHRRLPNSSCFHFCPPQTDTPVHPLFYSLSLSLRTWATLSNGNNCCRATADNRPDYYFIHILHICEKKKKQNIFISLWFPVYKPWSSGSVHNPRTTEAELKKKLKKNYRSVAVYHNRAAGRQVGITFPSKAVTSK